MALTDPIANMLTVIRNASSTKKEVVEVRNSRFSEELLRIFKKEGFIENYKLVKDNKQGILRVYLRYGKDGTPALLGLKRVSKPSLRIYKGKGELPKVYGGLGSAIVSTSKGVMTDKEARAQKIGGEVICYIW
ncbi:MAG: 30S ribosomal protein S8 [Candidatus Omnitrophica bacterium]|nr:30S ribosomal protein S8 [Candidatus Omnitrophota bacterium]